MYVCNYIPFELPFGIMLTDIIGKIDTWYIILLFCVCGRIRQVLGTHVFACFLAALAIKLHWQQMTFQHVSVITMSFSRSRYWPISRWRREGCYESFAWICAAYFLDFQKHLTGISGAQCLLILGKAYWPESIQWSRVGCFSFCLRMT